MPHSLDKTAATTTASFDELVKVMKKHNVKNPKQVAEHLLGGDSGSIILNGAGAILKKIPKGDKAINGFKHMQNKLVDIDIKAGKKVHDTLGKSHIGKKFNKAFVYNHEVPLESKIGKPDKSITIGVPMLSAPLEKAKKTVLPVAGSFYIADKLMGSDNKKEGGDTVKAANLSREELMDKIASNITGNKEEVSVKNDTEKVASALLLKASKMLKFAAEDRKQLLADMEKLAFENKKLNDELVTKEKHNKAVKLAEQMNEKGMIKKADIDKKAEEIMLMDDNAYMLLKQATENVSMKNEKNGLDNLTFLTQDGNIESSKKTLADSLLE